MATISQNQDGTLTLTLTSDELDTYSGMPQGQLDAYITIFLKDKQDKVLVSRFQSLSQADRDFISSKLKKN